MRLWTLLWLGVVLLFSGCRNAPRAEVASLTPEEVAQLLPVRVKDRLGWASDIISAIQALEKTVTTERACSVIAIIEQESGYQVDPLVPNLPQIVRKGLEHKFRKLGPLRKVVVSRILQMKVPGEPRTFQQRINRLKTESDLDRLFRDLEAALRRRFPGPATVASLTTKLMGRGWLEEFNPVTTAGPMQVKVAYAKQLPELRRLSDGEARDLLYTRKGGVRAGTARLLDYQARYDNVLYRFADYNSGVYSSRNAAFQSQLSDVGNLKVDFDGDLLAYHPDGNAFDEPTHTLRAMIAFGREKDLSERSIRHAAQREKTESFEDEVIWKLVRESWQKKKGKPPPYARLPTVFLDSPKLSSRRSTQWFAESVHHRYIQCRQREKHE